MRGAKGALGSIHNLLGGNRPVKKEAKQIALPHMWLCSKQGFLPPSTNVLPLAPKLMHLHVDQHVLIISLANWAQVNY